VPLSFILRVLNLVEQGFTSLDFEEYNTHYEGEAYNTVSGQNSNNSVRVTNAFMKAVEMTIAGNCAGELTRQKVKKYVQRTFGIKF
jgi:hypothetical protein